MNRHVWNQADRIFHQLLPTALQQQVVYMKTNMLEVNSTVSLVAAIK